MIPVLFKRKSYRVTGADGVKVLKLGGVSYVLGSGRRRIYAGAWDVSVDVVEQKIYVGKGYVNELEPQVNGEPLSGIYHDGAESGVVPSLKLAAGCVLLRIKPNEMGRVEGDPSLGPYLAAAGALVVEMGDLAEARVYNPEELVVPLALVGTSGKLMQMAFFNYKYRRERVELFGARYRHALSTDVAFARSIDDEALAGAGEGGDGVELNKKAVLRKQYLERSRPAANMDPGFPYASVSAGMGVSPAQFNPGGFRAVMAGFGPEAATERGG
jgi:hypothetical protein